MSDIEAELVRVLRSQPPVSGDLALLDRVHARIGRQRRTRRAAIAAVMSLVVAGAALVIGISHQHAGYIRPSAPHHRNPIVARLPAGPVGSGMAVLGADLWAFSQHGYLTRIDTRTNKVTVRRHIAGLRTGIVALAAGQGRLWLAASFSGTRPGQDVFAVNPVSGRLVARLDLGGTCYSESAATDAPIMTFGAGHLWVVCWSVAGNRRRVLRIDPRTDRIDAETGVIPGSGNERIVAGPEGIWYSTDTTKITKIDPSGTRTDRVAVSDAGYPFSLSGADLAMGQGALWALATDETIASIDPATGRIVRYYDYRDFDPKYTFSAQAFAIGFGSVWLLGDRLLRLSARTGRVQAGVDLGSPGTELAITRDAVWVGTLNGVIRIDPARVAP